MLIGWFVARRDIRRRLDDLRRVQSHRGADRALLEDDLDPRQIGKGRSPATGLGHVIDGDGAAGECFGHAAARPRDTR